MYISKIFRNEDSLDDFDNRRRVSPDSKYITFSGWAKNAVRDGVKKALNKKNILNPWIGTPGLQDFRFAFNVRNKEKDVRDALTGLNALGERNTWFIQYKDGANIVNPISDFSPDIPNGLWYSGDMGKIVDFIMPKKGKAEASTGENEGAIKEYLEYEKGYKNSRGEDAPWVIRNHKGGKVLASFAKKADAEAHLERMKRYSKDEVADSAGFSRFVKNLLDAAIDMFDDATWNRLVKDYDFGDDFEKGRSVADSLKNMQGWVLATEKRHTDEKLFNKEELESMAMNDYKAAVKAAWSAAGVKNFKIDHSDGSNKVLNVWPKTLDGNFYDVYWSIMPALGVVIQYSTEVGGDKNIEREIPFKDADEIETIFTDEFKNLDAVMDDGNPSQSKESKTEESAPYIQCYVITGGTGPESGEESEREKIDISGDPEHELWDMVLKEIPADYEQHLFVNNNEFDNLIDDDDIAALKTIGLDAFKKKHGIDKITSMGYYTHPWSGMTSDLMDYRIKGETPKSETAPDEYARDNFLKGALAYAEIEDDKGNVVLLKIVKRYANEIGGDFCLRSYDGETDKSLAMGGIRYVVGRYGELLDMDPADAILEIAKE